MEAVILMLSFLFGVVYMSKVVSFYQPRCSLCNTMRSEKELSLPIETSDPKTRYKHASCVDKTDCETKQNLKILEQFFAASKN